MSYHDKTDEERREERRRYDGDVVYEVWRAGRDCDRINYDRVADHFHAGDDSATAASVEIRAQRQIEERRRIQAEEEQQQEEPPQEEPPTP